MLALDRLTKRFDTTLAVADLSLVVEKGELLTLLGPSGCGKTTTLRMLAGFEAPTAGRIRLERRDITALPPQRREIGMVFQSYALFPHLDVYENVAFGLKARGVARREAARRVAEALALVDLAGFERRRVQELSGGQQQRVALARALAPEPPILLLDEPLSNLDAALRERTRGELRSLLKRLGITTVFVTHDQEEAFALSDRIAVMNLGRLEQLGSPETLYHRPATPFVAAFLGRANFLPATVDLVDGPVVVCRLPDGGRWHARLAAASRARVAAAATPVPAGPAGPPATIDSGEGDAAAHGRDVPGAAGPASAAAGDPERGDDGEAGGGWGRRAPAVGDAVRLMIRPEALRIAPVGRDAGRGHGSGVRAGGAGIHGGSGDAGPADDAVPGTVLERRFAGATTIYQVRAGELDLLAWGAPGDASPGDDVLVRPAPGAAIHAFPPPDRA